MTARITPEQIEQVIVQLTSQRGNGKTICPSEVARKLSVDDWRRLMPDVRQVAAKLAKRGQIVVKQGGVVVDVETATGPIRLGIWKSSTSR